LESFPPRHGLARRAVQDREAGREHSIKLTVARRKLRVCC
jgi:hypothetical protein